MLILNGISMKYEYIHCQGLLLQVAVLLALTLSRRLLRRRRYAGGPVGRKLKAQRQV
jgi:hypothetical protein